VTALSIIIVNYKSATLIIECLRTIYARTKNIDFEIIIVDNDSKDNSKESILSTYPAVRWIGMDCNAGFARANNEGIRQSKAEVVLLLNPDTLVNDDAIDKCYRLFINSPFVACGVQLLNPDLSPQISGNYFVKGGLNYLLPLPYFGHVVKSLGILFKAKKPNVPNAESTVEVDWINGAFLMVKKSAIQHAGLLDEDFFMYAEETEWCSRLKKEGKLCIFGELKVIHLQGETALSTFNSSDKTYANLFDRKGLQIMLSNMVRIRKQFGIGWFLLMLAFYVFEIPIFLFGFLFSKIFYGSQAKYHFSQCKGYSRNVIYVLKMMSRIISNKPYFYKVL